MFFVYVVRVADMLGGMCLSVIVPVYNEAKTVADIMQRLAGALPDAQVIYVDDGSKDDSLNILKAHARPHDIVLTKPNGGKGSAIRLGLEKSEGMYTVIQDADLEYTPLDIPALLKEAEAHPGSAIFGSRFLTDNPVMYKRFLMGNKVLSLIVSILFGRRITDSYTCYKLLPTDVFRGLGIKSSGFEMEAEICAKCLRRGRKLRNLRRRNPNPPLLRNLQQRRPLPPRQRPQPSR